MMLISLSVWLLFTTTLSESNINLKSPMRYKRQMHDITKNVGSLNNDKPNKFHSPSSGGVILKGGADLPADFKGSGSADFAFAGESFRSQPLEVKQSHNEDTYSKKTDDLDNLSSHGKENKNNQKYRSIDDKSKEKSQNNWNQKNRNQNDEKTIIYKKIWDDLFSTQSNQSNYLENTTHKSQDKNNDQDDWTAIIFPSESNTNIFVNLTGDSEDLITNHSIKSIVTTDTTTTSTTTTTSPNIANVCQRRCHLTVTGEYNPRCASDGVTYTNPGKLRCALKCGRKITIRKYSACGSLSPVI